MYNEIAEILKQHGFTLSACAGACAETEEPMIYTVAYAGENPPPLDITIFMQADDSFTDMPIMVWYEKRGVMHEACVFDDPKAILEEIQFLISDAAKDSMETVRHLINNPILR